MALAIVVLDRSDSAFYAAMAFVVGYLSSVLGGIVLSPFADRLPRKQVMIACDLTRAAIVGVLALLATESTPLWVLFGLLLAAELFTQPFTASRQATVPDVLPDPQEYLAGTGLMRSLHQVNQVIGLTLAAVIVQAFTARIALIIDAATFMVSCLVIVRSVRSRPSPLCGSRSVRSYFVDMAAGVRLVFGHPARRSFVLLAWGAIGFMLAPEAIALAYAREHGAAHLGGYLLASVPAGSALGVLMISRLKPVHATRLAPRLAAASFLPLLLTATDPPPEFAMLLWFVSGFLQAFITAIIAAVNLITPREGRGRVNGIAAAGTSLFAASGFALSGWLADFATPAAAVGIASLGGLAAVALLTVGWHAATTILAAQPTSTAPAIEPLGG